MTPQAKQQRIQELLSRLDQLQSKTLTGRVHSLIGEEREKAASAARETLPFKALEELAGAMDKISKEPQANRVLGMLNRARSDNQKSLVGLTEKLVGAFDSVEERLRDTEARGADFTKQESARVLKELAFHKANYQNERFAIDNRTSLLDAEVTRTKGEFERMFNDLGVLVFATQEQSDVNDTVSRETTNALSADIDALSSKVDIELLKIEKDLTQRVVRIAQQGSGNMNRNVAINGNVSVLSMFTDINFKAGAGVTLTYASNVTTGFTDITIAATGGGGGITRQINNVAVPTLMAETPGIDQVYLASGTITLTLPTSVSNTNLYTVKNIGAGIVTINTTGGETIDGSATLVMPLQFTSVDLISNNAGNWNIT